MAYKQYCDLERDEALILLAVNRYNVLKTSEQTGISRNTLKKWSKERPKKEVPALLERAIERLLMVIPSNMDGRDWAVALGILMDKWLLVHGKATQRTENLVEFIQQMPDSDLNELIGEFEQAANRSPASLDESGAEAAISSQV
jgi:hypothetical protein